MSISMTKGQTATIGGLIALILLGGVAGSVSAQKADSAESPAPLVLILDASGSMWGQIEGENKIVIARRVVGGLVDGLSDEQEVGLIAYGHRREGDCEDIETILPIGALDRAGFKQTVDDLNPKGKTPITASVQQALALVEQQSAASTVILVSDGLETCGGDPCSTVQLAKDQGLDFVMHVVGFDVAGEDTSSLECAAEAGGGLFLSAENATELGLALEQAVALTPEVPDGRLAVTAIRNGELHDVWINVKDSAGVSIGGGRTYTQPATNPSAIPLPDGRFKAHVSALGVEGDAVRQFEFEIVDGSKVERTVDFSTGELSIGVTRNGQLSDATYRVTTADGEDSAARGRTYTTAGNNPSQVTLTTGTYRVSVKGLEIEGAPEVDLGEVEIAAGGQVEVAHDFDSGELAVTAVSGGEMVDGVVQIYDSEGASVGGTRTYAKEKVFVLEPGDYTLRVRKVRGEKAEAQATVTRGERVEISVEVE